MQFIIDFIDSATQQQINAYITSNNLTDLQLLSAKQKCYVANSSVELLSDELVTVTRNDNQPLTLLSTYQQTVFDTNAPENWWKIASFTKPDYTSATQSYDIRGGLATVYLVDSGINTTHSEFVNSNISSLYSFNGNLADVNGHGTALASVLVGSTCGLTNATVKSVKIFEDGFDTLQSHFVAAMDAILLDSAANPQGMKIVNLSWSIPKNAYIESKIQLLIDAGIKVVVAAGNSGIPIENVTPASMSDVFTVGAYSEDLAPCDFSNYTGTISTTQSTTNYGEIDVWAPGENIRAVIGFGTLGNISGTSVAAIIQTAAFAYNSDVFVLSDGSLPYAVTPMSAINSTTVLGLLTLTGQYANNVNATTVFRGEYDGDNGLKYRTISSYNITAMSGERISKHASSFLEDSQFEISDPLPAGLIIDNGWIEGVIGTSQSTESFYWESPVVITKHDNSVVYKLLRIGIIPSAPAQALPENDPALQLSLLTCAPHQNVVNGTWSCSGGCGESDFCRDACGVVKVGEPDGLQCTCSSDEICD